MITPIHTLIPTLLSILFFFLPTFAHATTVSDLESKIAALLSQIQTLQTELQTLKTGTPTPTPQAPVTSSFIQTLGKGSEGSEVIKLQFDALTESAVKTDRQVA